MKVKKLTTVLLAMAMMVVFAQSAFADPYYTNPNGSVNTASLLTLGKTASDQISFANEVDYFKVNTAKNKKVKITLKSPECVYNSVGFLVCVNYDFTVFELVGGVAKNVKTANDVGGIGGTDTLEITTTETQLYIKVFGHPQAPIGVDPFGNPIINHYSSAISNYQIKASYL